MSEYYKTKNGNKITSDSIAMENTGMTLDLTLNPLRSFRGLSTLADFVRVTANKALTGTIRFRDDNNIFGINTGIWLIGHYIYQNPFPSGSGGDVGGWFYCGANNGHFYIIKITGNINDGFTYTKTQLV